MGMRPSRNILVFDKITKKRPFKFPEGNRAAKFYFFVVNSNYFPIAPPGPTLNGDFLAELERVGPKKSYLGHRSSRIVISVSETCHARSSGSNTSQSPAGSPGVRLQTPPAPPAIQIHRWYTHLPDPSQKIAATHKPDIS
jgi:hypothetical protein